MSDPAPTNPPTNPSTTRASQAPSAAPGAGPASSPAIQYDDFAKIELKIATVVDCQPHPNADKLLVLQIDLGSERRQICAGIKQWTKPEELIGKQIVVVANLKPARLRGVESRGMILAASDDSGVHVLAPDALTAPGSKVK